MRKVGILLLVLGVLGLIFFGIDAYQQSESFSVVGVDVAVTKANWNPVIFSGVVAVIGLGLMGFSKRK